MSAVKVTLFTVAFSQAFSGFTVVDLGGVKVLVVHVLCILRLFCKALPSIF